MTEEDKKLLLVDLCARLPYGFTIHRYSDNCDIVIESNGIDEFAHFLEYSEGEDFKPYLRPMSSMTDKERAERIALLWELEGHIDEDVTYKYQDWLNAHHFDYRGLIPMGLALEAIEGMYKV